MIFPRRDAPRCFVSRKALSIAFVPTSKMSGFVSTGDANYMQTFFGWRFVHLLLHRAEDNKAALCSNNTFHQRISELAENVTRCPSAAFWLLESNLGPLAEKAQAFISSRSCSNVLSVSSQRSQEQKVTVAHGAVPGPSAVHPARGRDGRLICHRRRQHKAPWATGQGGGTVTAPRRRRQEVTPPFARPAEGTGLWDITVLSALTGAARPSPLGGKNGSCAFWFLLRPKLRDSFLFQPSIAEIAQQVKLLILDRYIGLCAST